MKLQIKDLYDKIIKCKSEGESILLGIDGCGGAGKSTLAEAFKKWDCSRVKNEVLIPLYNNRSAQYQRYDWNEDKLAEWHTIPYGGLVIIEGCYSLIHSLREFYDFKIWVESPKDLRLSRGIERDGEEKRHLWEGLWMPSEEYYIKIQKPFESADLVIDGTGKNSNIENLEVTVLMDSIL